MATNKSGRIALIFTAFFLFAAMTALSILNKYFGKELGKMLLRKYFYNWYRCPVKDPQNYVSWVNEMNYSLLILPAGAASYRNAR